MTAVPIQQTPEVTVPADPRTATRYPARSRVTRQPRAPRLGHWLSAHRGDLLVHAFFLAGALYVMAHLWIDVNHRVLGNNPGDQSFAEWMYVDQARALTTLRNPFFSHGQNAPLGINLMGNVATQLVSWVMTPITLLFGPAVTFAIAITVNLAATASAWYHVMSRHLVRHRPAAFIGALFCGFSPGMISESNAHVHIPAQYLVPFLLLAVIRLGRADRVSRNGVVLGLLVAAQLLIGEEVLFLTAIGCAIMVAGYAVQHRTRLRAMLRPFLTGLAVAGVVALAICAYPLWMQFFGPRHYRGIMVTFSADLSNIIAYPTQSLGGLTSGTSFVPDLAEEASFFGWPLALGTVGLAVLLWRSVAVRLVAITGAVTAVLSLGPHIMWKGHDTGVPGPYLLLSRLPVFDSLITLRLALVTAVAVGLLLAFAVDWVMANAAGRERLARTVRAVALIMGVVMLVPLIPRPLPAIGREPIPRFVSEGGWQRYVREGRTLVPVDPGPRGNLRWAVAGGAHFVVPRGFTLVPRNPPHNLVAVVNVPLLPTESLLWQIGEGRTPLIGATQQQRARADLTYLHADAVVLAVSPQHPASMVAQISTLLDRPVERVEDVYVWRVSEG